MAKTRKRPTKAAAAARTDELFDDGAGEQAAQLERAAEAQREAEAPDRIAADEMGPQPPPHVPDPRGAERAWESYPAISGRCATCSGALRVTGPAMATCRRGHENELRADDGPGEAPAPPRVDEAGLRAFEGAVAGKRTSTGARVAFVEVPTTRLEQLDLADVAAMNPADRDLRDAFVKVTAALRPSEREAFDGRALKEELHAAGARAVLLAVHPVAEAPDREAKAEASTALRPEDAIAAWFDGLPVPEEDRAAAREIALEILAAEGG